MRENGQIFGKIDWRKTIIMCTLYCVKSKMFASWDKGELN